MRQKQYDYARTMDDCPSFHIEWCQPNDVWPNGGWSVYQINGDEIAARIIKDERGRVDERHADPILHATRPAHQGAGCDRRAQDGGGATQAAAQTAGYR